jgi:hypothetical protein
LHGQIVDAFFSERRDGAAAEAVVAETEGEPARLRRLLFSTASRVPEGDPYAVLLAARGRLWSAKRAIRAARGCHALIRQAVATTGCFSDAPRLRALALVGVARKRQRNGRRQWQRASFGPGSGQHLFTQCCTYDGRRQLMRRAVCQLYWPPDRLAPSLHRTVIFFLKDGVGGAPIYRLHTVGCPILFLQGGADNVFRRSEARLGYELLRSHGLPTAYHEIEDGDHVLGNVAQDATRLILTWLRECVLLQP